MIDALKNNRRIVLVVVGILILLGLAYSTNKSNSLDSLPEEANSAEYSRQVVMLGGSELLRELGGVKQFDYIRADLYYFGKKKLPGYSGESSVIIGFEVTSKIMSKDGIVSFEGKYGSSKHKILVSVSLLRNERVKTSIVDDRNKDQINDQLPSNSAINQFIGTLPTQGDAYEISYGGRGDDILISVFEDTPENINAVKDRLKSAASNGDISQINYKILIPTSASEGSPIAP